MTHERTILLLPSSPAWRPYLGGRRPPTASLYRRRPRSSVIRRSSRTYASVRTDPYTSTITLGSTYRCFSGCLPAQAPAMKSSSRRGSRTVQRRYRRGVPGPELGRRHRDSPFLSPPEAASDASGLAEPLFDGAGIDPVGGVHPGRHGRFCSGAPTVQPSWSRSPIGAGPGLSHERRRVQPAGTRRSRPR